MANIKSAKKRVKVTKAKTLQNKMFKSSLKTEIKKFKAALAGGDKELASKAYVAVVKKVDKAAGKVTLSHGPLTNLGMNMPMTMAFRVKDATWLDQMKDGDKIRFVAEDINGVLTVVKFEPAK